MPFIFAACTITGALGVMYWVARLDRDADVRDEPDRARRARDRDRLLAARRLPLPRGARRARTTPTRRSSARWRRPAGRAVLRRSGGDRPADAGRAASAVHAADGHRRLPHPARLAARRGDAAADAPAPLRPPWRRAPPVPAAARRAGRRRARLLGVAGPFDHAQAAALSRCRLRDRRRAHRARVLALADAGLVVRRPTLAARRSAASTC